MSTYLSMDHTLVFQANALVCSRENAADMPEYLIASTIFAQNCLFRTKLAERLPFTSATTRHKSQKLWQQNATIKCHYKVSLQIVTTNQSKICISDTSIYFPHGKWCKCTWNVVYLAQMKSFDFVVTFFVACRVGKCDKKVSTSCCHIFVTCRGEKCDDKLRYLSGWRQRKSSQIG